MNAVGCRLKAEGRVSRCTRRHSPLFLFLPTAYSLQPTTLFDSRVAFGVLQ